MWLSSQIKWNRLNVAIHDFCSCNWIVHFGGWTRIQTKNIFSKILMNCGQSYLNTEAMIFVLQSINFHLWHKNMHAACTLPSGVCTESYWWMSSQYRWTQGHCNVSNRKAKTSAIGLVFFPLWFILYIYYEVIKIILLGEAVGGKHVLECVLFTPLNDVSVIRELGYAGHILERNRTAWQIPNRRTDRTNDSTHYIRVLERAGQRYSGKHPTTCT